MVATDQGKPESQVKGGEKIRQVKVREFFYWSGKSLSEMKKMFVL